VSERASEEIIVFLHLPKTGGSSVRALLAARFEPDMIIETVRRGPDADRIGYISGEVANLPPWDGTTPNSLLDEQLRTLSPGQSSRLRLVQGHCSYGVHEVLPRPAAYVTLLRDPIERVLSLYSHRVRLDGLKMGLDDYVRGGRDFAVDNAQVRMLAGVVDGDPRLVSVTEEMLERARRHLQEMQVVGVTDRFDEFVVLLGRRFGWRRLTAPFLNRDPGRLRASGVEPSVVEEVRARNWADSALYDDALALIAERTRPNRAAIDQEIRRLRSRTARHEAAGRAAARMTGKLRGARVKLGRALRTGGTAGGS
jgi:hypothetical protein